jgi:hypothetical protein
MEVVNSSEILITLMMEALSTSETSVDFYEATRCNIPEDSHFHTHRRVKPAISQYHVYLIDLSPSYFLCALQI